jgi:hypothetical protein
VGLYIEHVTGNHVSDFYTPKTGICLSCFPSTEVAGGKPEKNASTLAVWIV